MHWTLPENLCFLSIKGNVVTNLENIHSFQHTIEENNKNASDEITELCVIWMCCCHVAFCKMYLQDKSLSMKPDQCKEPRIC